MSRIGDELVEAMAEALAHVEGKGADLVRHTVEVPDAPAVAALRKRMRLSRAAFAARFGLDPRAVQDWEQGRRRPDRAARVLLAVIEKEPDAVTRALATPDRGAPAVAPAGSKATPPGRRTRSGPRRGRGDDTVDPGGPGATDACNRGAAAWEQAPRLSTLTLVGRGGWR